MQYYEVWAPKQKSVAVKIGEEKFAMQPDQNGWWCLALEAAPGQDDGSEGDYQFILEDGTVCPDPRSAWQPHGVHGPSRKVDHSRFAWSDQGWQAPPLASAIIYELHTGTFTPEGTFEAAVEKLDHLVDLGVTHIELMPVSEFPGERGWGYDGVDLYAPHHAYGGPEGLKRLVNACHKKGLAVLLDVVYNHLGPDGNYLSLFGPYFTNQHHTAWGDAVNFDGPGSDEVRRFFTDNAFMWLRDYHFDGLRLDAVHAMIDTSAVHFLEHLSKAVNALETRLGRHLVLIAESDLNDPRIVRPRLAGGYGIHAQWSDDFHHALHSLLTGEQDGYYADYGRMEHLAEALTHVFVYHGQYSPFRGRTHGRPVTSLPSHAFLGYLQNHDQIGNRAKGERIGHLIDLDRLMIGAALVFTAPFVPMVFQGEEWNASAPFQFFTDHPDPELGQAASEGRRKEFSAFGWEPEQVPDPQSAQTFVDAILRWEETGQEPYQCMLEWYRQLIHLRQTHPALSPANWENTDVQYDAEAGWFILKRDQVSVVCNFSPEVQAIPAGPGSAPKTILLASANMEASPDGRITLAPNSVVILEAV